MPCHRVTLSLRAVSIYLRHSKVWFLKRLFISHDHNIWSCDCCQGALATSRLHLLKLQQYSTKVRALMYADKQRLFCCVALLWPSQALCSNQSGFPALLMVPSGPLSVWELSIWSAELMALKNYQVRFSIAINDVINTRAMFWSSVHGIGCTMIFMTNELWQWLKQYWHFAFW
mgnify:CR=1 FL=1